MEIEDKEPALDDEDIEMIEDTADRLTDLALALSFFDPSRAKTSLALALGNMCGHEDEEPCLHHAFEIAEEQHEFIREQRAEAKTESEKPNN